MVVLQTAITGAAFMLIVGTGPAGAQVPGGVAAGATVGGSAASSLSSGSGGTTFVGSALTNGTPATGDATSLPNAMSMVLGGGSSSAIVPSASLLSPTQPGGLNALSGPGGAGSFGTTFGGTVSPATSSESVPQARASGASGTAGSAATTTADPLINQLLGQ